MSDEKQHEYEIRTRMDIKIGELTIIVGDMKKEVEEINKIKVEIDELNNKINVLKKEEEYQYQKERISTEIWTYKGDISIIGDALSEWR